AMVMLARALGIEPAGTSVLNGYADAANVPDWARGYVAALLRADIVSGSRLAALANITRAQFVTILDRAIAIYTDEDGATVKADDVDGIIVVVAEDVQIKNAPAGTKVVAAASAKSLKVNGKSVDANDIHIVPETVERPKSVGHAHSHEYKYTDNGDGTHTGVCTANDSTLDPEAHTIVDGKCTICGAEQPETAVASVLGEDGTYAYYDSLIKALNAVANGGTVKLTNDVSNFAGVTITKDLTIDFGTYTLTGAVGAAVIKVQNAAVTLTGTTGGINGGFGGDNVAIWALDDCTINITGGNYTVGGDASGLGNSTVYVNGSGTVNISGGHFSSEKTYQDKYYVLNLNNSNHGSISVTGGTFVGQNPADGDDNQGGCFVADGYFALPNGDGTYTVVTADQITSGVTIQGIAGYEHSAFATVADAYSEINPKVAALGGLGQETCSKEAFDALYTDDAKITWTIYGKQALVAGSEGKDAHTFTFGRAASYYRNDCNIAAIIVKGGNDSAALDLSATGGTFALPYNWWGEKIKNCEVSFTGITFDGIKSIPSTWASQAQSTPYTFDRCTFNGSVYGYHDYNINLTIQNSTFNAPENTDYAVMLQSTAGINGTVTLDHNTFNGYTRGVNLQRPGTDFIFTNNTIISTVSKPDRAAIQLTDGKSFVVNGNTVRVNAGNAFWFHSAATNDAVTYTISNNNIQAPYLGYSAASFDVNPKITSSGNIFNSTDTTRCMEKEATEATPTNLTAIQ
ncbi:MAG: S-layer homology domain-containing protein, partial [Clostridiales bacterium]|nr:S-layer homology domain-containing protein [Subdoligranulum variabile]MCI6604319.1 S-layer homology domain-containing protein [Clostridiales bacterium]